MKKENFERATTIQREIERLNEELKPILLYLGNIKGEVKSADSISLQIQVYDHEKDRWRTGSYSSKILLSTLEQILKEKELEIFKLQLEFESL